MGGELQLLELHTPVRFFSVEPPGWDAAQEKPGWLLCKAVRLAPAPCPILFLLR